MDVVLATEARVLGAALQSRSSAAKVTQRLSADDFRGGPHRLVFLAIVAVQRSGGHGAVPVVQELVRTGQLDAVGGAATVHALLAEAPFTPVELEIDGVLRASRRRRMHAAGQRIIEAAKDAEVPEDQLTGIAVDALVRAHIGYEDEAGIVRIRDLWERMDSLYDGATSLEGVSTGWDDLDAYYKPAKGWWTVVTGIPGHGKSSWVDALTVNLARLHGWRFAVSAPESLPHEKHALQLTSIHAGKPYSPRHFGRMTRGEYEASRQWVDEHFTFLMPDELGRNIDTILALARLEHHVRPIDGLVIDPWNELDHSRPPAMTETEYVSRSLTRLRAFAHEHEIHVWLVAHPTKLQKQPNGTYPVPTLYDISGSAHWRNKADNGIAVWRDHGDLEGRTEIHVQKIRSQPYQGVEGMTFLRHDPITKTFSDGVGPRQEALV